MTNKKCTGILLFIDKNGGSDYKDVVSLNYTIPGKVKKTKVKTTRSIARLRNK